MNIYTFSQQKVLFYSAWLGLLLFVGFGIYEYISGVFIALILYGVLHTPCKYLQIRWGFSSYWATLSALVLSVLVLLIPFLSASILISQKLLSFKKKVPEIIHQWETFRETYLKSSSLPEAPVDISIVVEGILNKTAIWAGNAFPGFLGATVDSFIAVLVVYFLLYYMLKEDQTLRKGMYQYLPFPKVVLKEMISSFQNLIKSHVLGQGLISLTQACLLTIGIASLGYEDPIFWGMSAFFVSFIPYLGTPIIFVPLSMSALLHESWTQGFGLLLYGFLFIINVDNLLRMYVGKKVGNIHPLISFIGILAGVPLFGLMGVFIGPLLVMFFNILTKHLPFAEKKNRIL